MWLAYPPHSKHADEINEKPNSHIAGRPPAKH